MRLSIIIPFYNESESVAKFRQEFLPVVETLVCNPSFQGDQINGIELVFVDDGSTDDSFARLKEAFSNYSESILVTRFEKHDINRGLGAAIRTGFAASTGEVIVTTDFDGTYKFSEITELLSRLASDVDLVTASPYHPSGGVVGVPAYRLILSRGSSLIYRVLVRWDVYTYTSLFRAYRRSVIEAIDFESDGFLAGTELLVKSVLGGFRVSEYPAILYKRSCGISKAKLLQTTLAHLRFQLQVLVHRLGFRSIYAQESLIGGHKWTRSVQPYPGAEKK